MQENNNPITWTYGTWALAFGVSIAGGIVNFYARVKRGHTRAFNFIELIGEMFIAGLVGLMAFMVVTGFNYPIGLAAAAAGVGGHMGTRLLFIAEHALEARFPQFMKHSNGHEPEDR